MNNDSNDSTDRDTLIDLQPYGQEELDQAMRELEEIEAVHAANHDLGILRKVWAARAGKAILGAAIVWGAMLFGSTPAHADTTKVKKPTLCLTGTPVTGTQFSGFLCTDGKKPRLFTKFMVVKFVDSEGNPASYVLGWTGVQPKATPAPVATLKL